MGWILEYQFPDYVGYVDAYIQRADGIKDLTGEFAPAAPTGDHIDRVWIHEDFDRVLKGLSSRHDSEALCRIKEVYDSVLVNSEPENCSEINRKIKGVSQGRFLQISKSPALTLWYRTEHRDNRDEVFFYDLIMYRKPGEIEAYIENKRKKTKNKRLSKKRRLQKKIGSKLLDIEDGVLNFEFIINPSVIKEKLAGKKKNRLLDGIEKNDVSGERIFQSIWDIRCSLKYYIQQKKYGFDERELWFLDCNFAKYLYSRIKLFLDVTPIDLAYHKMEIDGKIYTQEQVMYRILDNLRGYISSGGEDGEAGYQEAMRLWGIVHGWMWW